MSAAATKTITQSKTQWTLAYAPPHAPWSRMEFRNQQGAQWRAESLVKSFPSMKAHLHILPPNGAAA